MFDKADVSGDGKVSLDEFMAMCDEFGVQLSEKGKEELKIVFREEVYIFGIPTEIKLWNLQLSKSDFILHLKKNNLARHFEVPDPESDEKWNNVAITAFK